jgi:outer membrane protein OmpA-like peptidoglycan-associated protein
MKLNARNFKKSKLTAEPIMTRHKERRFAVLITQLLVGLLLLSTDVAAQSVKVEGLINMRSGDTMIVKTSGSADVTVLLTDSTEVGQIQGVFKARRKQMSMAALIPGLQVKVEGTYNDQKQLVAKTVAFKGNDLQDAEKIEAGMHETKVQVQEHQAELEKQNAALQAQNEALKQQQVKLTEHEAKIAANKAAVDAAIARFGQLDDYYIFDEVTVYFANGKTKVDPKYTPQLLALADKAKTIEGYMIEVKGFASTVGSTELNQQLSEDRSDAVTNILIQQGHILLTRMLAPGAMGETHQVGSDKTEKGQAENRRVVVRVLQNKGIAGI